MYLSCGFYFRQERRIACSAEKGERNGEKQQGGYELCKGKKYTVSDVSKAERHNERKNETYENINMIEVTEQVGRLGCFGFMIINIPGTWFGRWSDEALALSIIPSMLFLFSGIMSRSVLLIIASVLFAPSHIVISYKNVK